MVKVSVVIPVFNGQDFVGEAIDSVLNQTFRDFEVIAIDDGSTDETPDILRAYGDQITWQSQGNYGQASAINRGVGLAAGEYVAYLDADDVCLPERLEVQVHYLESHPDVALVYSDRYEIDKFGKVQGVMKSRATDNFLLLQQDYVPRSTVMQRKACLNEIGLFDEAHTGNDDWDMWVRMSEQYRLSYIDQPLIGYRIHDKNISIIRPRRLNYNRWTRMRMLKEVYSRRGKPFWLKLMLWRAKAEWLIGRTPFLGESFPGVWLRADELLNVIERMLLKKRSEESSTNNADKANPRSNSIG